MNFENRTIMTWRIVEELQKETPGLSDTNALYLVRCLSEKTPLNEVYERIVINKNV